MKNRSLLLTLFFMILGIMTIQVTKPFWVVLRPIFNTIQFPRRFMIVGAVLLVFAIALMIEQSNVGEKYKKILITINLVLTVCVGIGTVRQMDITPEDYTNRIISDEIAGIGAGEEWLPLETTREMMTTPNLAVANDGTTVTGHKEKGKFTFIADEEKEYYDVPFVWYRGYQAITNNGQILQMDKNPQTSIARVYLPVDKSNHNDMIITVWYGSTTIQKLSYVINIISVILVIGAGIIWLRRSENYR